MTKLSACGVFSQFESIQRLSPNHFVLWAWTVHVCVLWPLYISRYCYRV